MNVDPINMLELLQPEIEKRCRAMLRPGETLGAWWDDSDGRQRVVIQGITRKPLDVRFIGQFSPSQDPGAKWDRWDWIWYDSPADVVRLGNGKQAVAGNGGA